MVRSRTIEPSALKPMEAEAVTELPRGPQWFYEPKYDGFRCIAYGNGKGVDLRSKVQKPLARYFPEVAAGLADLASQTFVLDGELVIAGEPFETLQLRLHPAESRIAKLAREYPARLIAFDLLMLDGRPYIDQPLGERREALEAFAKNVGRTSWLTISKGTRSLRTAESWLGKHEIEGIMAKRLDLTYKPGKRAMRKFKLWTTVDCVVGGLYWQRGSRAVDSLLLGLYDDDGQLNYVGHARVDQKDSREMGELLQPLIGGQGFSGRSPGGKNRWTGKEQSVVPLLPKLVAEVSADRITGQHFRHGARILRFRDDKRPRDCTMDQLPET